MSVSPDKSPKSAASGKGRKPISRRKFVAATAAGGAGTYLAWKLGLSELSFLETVQAQTSAGAFTEEWVPSTCWIGKQECSIRARVINGRVVKIEGGPDNPRNVGTLCPKGIAQIGALYDPNRVKTPLIRINGKGVMGQWRPATWDEALDLVASKIKAAPKNGFVWQKGRSKSEKMYDDAFVKATGAMKFGHGAYCSDAGYRAAEYTIGPHGVLHPDFHHTKYLLSWGWNITNAGGNKYCWITWNRQLLEAKARGLKVVQIDPRLRGAGPFADEWLPLRPGTDLALGLALANVIVEDGKIDEPYLTKYTSAPYLVGSNGLFLTRKAKVTKDGKEVEVDKELVWDTKTSSVVPFDTTGAAPALQGSYDVNGTMAKTGYTLFKEHVASYTPSWAAPVTGISATTIRRIARELVSNAQIGSTIVVDGVTLPYRPVSIMAYHMAQQEHGFGAIRMMLMVMMLLGAVEAVGGQRIDSTFKLYKNYEKFGHIKVGDPPYDIALSGSKFFPINSGNPSLVAKVLQNPAKYGVETTPEVMLIHMTNMAVSFGSTPDIEDMLRRYKFVAVIDPWLSSTADRFADVVLPAATLEKYEGPNGASDMYTDATVIRTPVMDPLFESRGEVDIYLDLTEKLGKLLGTGGYLDEVNKALELKEPNLLPTDRKLTTREVFDIWAKGQGITEGVEFFEKNGVKVKGPVSAKKYYGFALSPPFTGAVHRFYGASLVEAQNAMKAKGADEIYWRDYNAFPTWRAPTMDSSPSQYDLYLISFKLIEFKQGRASQIPLLAELAPEQYIEINPATAKARGIADGAPVWVESQNALTGETRKIQTRATYRESIRPDTVGMPHHYGNVAKHTGTTGQGPSPNQIFFTGEGYVGMTADQAFQVKVRVYPAGGEA